MGNHLAFGIPPPEAHNCWRVETTGGLTGLLERTLSISSMMVLVSLGNSWKNVLLCLKALCELYLQAFQEYAQLLHGGGGHDDTLAGVVPQAPGQDKLCQRGFKSLSNLKKGKAWPWHKTQVQIQRRIFGPKCFTNLGLHTSSSPPQTSSPHSRE